MFVCWWFKLCRSIRFLFPLVVAYMLVAARYCFNSRSDIYWENQREKRRIRWNTHDSAVFSAIFPFRFVHFSPLFPPVYYYTFFSSVESLILFFFTLPPSFLVTAPRNFRLSRADEFIDLLLLFLLLLFFSLCVCPSIHHAPKLI